MSEFSAVAIDAAEEEKHDGMNCDEDNDNRTSPSSPTVWSSRNVVLLKCLMSGVVLYAALLAYVDYQQQNNISSTFVVETETELLDDMQQQRRRLTAVIGEIIPSYMKELNVDLAERNKLFDDTPPEEVKYWFEYRGPLQKYFYRYSNSRGKADYFEGRDDSGVTSARFTEELLGGSEHNDMWNNKSTAGSNKHNMQYRLLENCLVMGSPSRPNTDTPLWKEWYGTTGEQHVTYGSDRCRALFTLNTVGAGRGTTMLWETSPPALPNAQGPDRWMSEQETAAMHIQRQLTEIDAMCATNQVAARVQVLVCEPIDARWTEWMDSLLPHCGGKISDLSNVSGKNSNVEERASPVQVVVVATMESAETCHDLKSGFMERRTQDLILAPPFLGDAEKASDIENVATKRTHPDLISSDDHDLYIGLKWTSLVTLRAVNSFLQASADIAAGAASPINNKDTDKKNNKLDETDVVVSNTPSSPFLVPSFTRVSYVSEENAKVAKWRMHGDFFHPAAWEICKDSFELTWINHSLSGPGGVNGLCYDLSTQSAMKRRLNKDGDAGSMDCGQWWIYMTELQMPNSPDVYANEVTPPIVQGGSNYVWMLTERQRREVVSRQVCLHKNGKDTPYSGKDFNAKDNCPPSAQAVVPLGDMESFLINYTPNTALGKKHVSGRHPGYSRTTERNAERKLVQERKQLKGQDDIEKALFDYTIYPTALFRKDATLKAARARDAVLSSEHPPKTDKDSQEILGPRWIKSEYYDVTVTKPRPPLLGWCMAIARKGLCTLYADYFRTSTDVRCLEACGMKKDFSPIAEQIA